MNSRYHHIVFIFFTLATIISCGGGGGAPGSTGSGDTGIMIKSSLLSMTSPDIDTYQDCCAVDPTTKSCTTLEKFTRDNATLTVTAENATPGVTAEQFPAKIQECTISYIMSNDDPAAPIIDALTIYPSCTLAEGSNTCDVTIIDIARKLQYSNPVIVNHTIIPANRPPHYVARMTCTYTNNFGKSGMFEADYDLWFDDFNHC